MLAAAERVRESFCSKELTIEVAKRGSKEVLFIPTLQKGNWVTRGPDPYWCLGFLHSASQLLTTCHPVAFKAPTEVPRLPIQCLGTGRVRYLRNGSSEASQQRGEN